MNRSKREKRFHAYWRSFLKEVNISSLTDLGKFIKNIINNVISYHRTKFCCLVNAVGINIFAKKI